MKLKELAVLSVIASVSMSVANVQSSMASKQNSAPSAPYEAWSTHKTVTVSADKMRSLPGNKNDSMVRVQTSNGNEQTLKLGGPLGKL